MKSKIVSKTIKPCAIVLLILLSSANGKNLADKSNNDFRPVDSNQIPKVLNMISDKIRGNYERIKTWEGKIEVVTDSIYKGARAERVFKSNTDGKGENPKVIHDHREQIIEFSVDTDKGFIYTSYCPTKPLQYTDPESGRDLGSKGVASRRRAIVTPEYQVDCMGDTMRDGVIMSRRAVKQARQKGSTCASTTHPVFDPRECFIVGKPIWETFPRVLEYMELHGELSVDGYALKVEERKDGNDTEYRIQIPGKVSPTDYLFMTMVFSGNKGFNIVSYEETDPKTELFERKESWDYDLFDGVYLPNITTEQIFDRKSGNLSYESTHTYNNLKVNQPIQGETFTYKNLGLKEGDLFIDKIADKKYTYKKDGSLKEVVKQKSDEKK